MSLETSEEQADQAKRDFREARQQARPSFASWNQTQKIYLQSLDAQ